jgi:hypothetical protein
VRREATRRGTSALIIPRQGQGEGGLSPIPAKIGIA